MTRPPVFVGVTTLPSRIGRLRPTIDSLLAQTLRPDRIFVSVPLRSVREGRGYVLPEWLASPPRGVQLVRCEQDYGPATKLLGCLPHITTDACLIVVDDDMVYKPFLVDHLSRAQLAQRDASFSFFVHRIGRIPCGQGADGFAFWTPNLVGIGAFAAVALESPHLFVHDDYWISVFLQSRGVSVLGLQHTLADGQFVWERTHADDQLSQLAGDLRRSKVTREGTRFLFTRAILAPRWRLACLLAYVELVLRSLWLRVASGIRGRRRPNR